MNSPLFIDLTGRRFTRLVVIERSSNNYKRGQAMWLCSCDCGNTTIVRSDKLISGRKKSCGCLLKDILLNYEEDIVGKRFGRLIVIKKNGSNSKDTLWLCQCDCGNTVVVKRGHLINNNTRSCGCLRKEKLKELSERRVIDLKGCRFGKLLVIKRVENGKQGVRWLCKCDCGVEKKVNSHNLLSKRGSTRSCGCMMFSNGAEMNFEEKKVYKLLQGWLPEEYVYNYYSTENNCFDFTIGGKCPDFVCEDRKKLIEYNGHPWHLKKRTGVNEKEHEEERINYFKQFGYNTLVIWKPEISLIPLYKLRTRLLNFHYDRIWGGYKGVHQL